MVRRWFGFSIGFCAWLVASVASAQGASDRVSLLWSAPAECPDRARLVREIEALLGQSLANAGEQALAVGVSVQGDSAQGYAAKISFTSSRGTEARYFEHANCENLVQAFALVIALAIDPERVRSTHGASDAERPIAATAPENPASPAPERAAAVPPSPLPARDVEQPGAHRPRPFARFALHGVGGAGPLPSFGLGLQATLGVQYERLRFDVLGRYWLPRDARVNELPRVKIELGLVTVGARACWLPLSGAWQLAACAGGDLGALRGTGESGVESARTNRARYSQLAAGLRAAYTLWRLAPELGFELSRALERPTFGVIRDGLDVPMFRPAALGLSAFLGIAFEP